MKPHSPLLGFNNNVKHKGRVFHIQTEDSGSRHPHIITHLFADGGRILKTTKTSYAEHVGADGMAETVRAMMKEQHKSMFIALRDGEFDHLFDEAVKVTGAAAIAPTIPAPEPGVPAPAAATAGKAEPNADGAAERAKHAPAAAAARKASPTVDGAGAPRAAPAVAAAEAAPIVDLDLDALERAAAEAQTPYFQQIHDLPPPPAAVLGKKRTSDIPGGGNAGSYRSVTPGQSGQPHIVSPPPPAPPVEKADRPAERPRIQQPSAGRYAPSRPAAIFATTRPAEGASIFGEDLISEKSLDEVILSYLAEDLDSQPPKK